MKKSIPFTRIVVNGEIFRTDQICEIRNYPHFPELNGQTVRIVNLKLGVYDWGVRAYKNSWPGVEFDKEFSGVTHKLNSTLDTPTGKFIHYSHLIPVL